MQRGEKKLQGSCKRKEFTHMYMCVSNLAVIVCSFPSKEYVRQEYIAHLNQNRIAKNVKDTPLTPPPLMP